MTNRVVDSVRRSGLDVETGIDVQKSLGRLNWLKRGAGLTIQIERWWSAFWPASMVVTGFVVVSLFGLWPILPAWLHALGLLGFLVALAATVWFGVRELRRTASVSAMTRLEQDSEIPTHSLDSLDDRPVAHDDDPLTRALWQREHQRAAGMISSLKLPTPRSPLPKRDPWALRAAMLLVLIVACIDASGQIGPRLAQSLEFQRSAMAAEQANPSARLWITPPSYTGLAPSQAETAAIQAGDSGVGVELQAPAFTQQIDVPEGSDILIQIQDLAAPFDDTLKVTYGDQTLEWSALGPNSAEVKSTLDATSTPPEQSANQSDLPATHLSVSQGETLIAEWPISLIDDTAPEINFTADPSQTNRGILKIDLEAFDDYGVAETILVIDSELLDEAMRLSVSKPRARTREFTLSRYLDLTANKLAGLPVTLQLEAVDAIDQFGHSETIETVLPERPFSHPLAQAIIAARKQLVAHPEQVYDTAQIITNLAESNQAMEFGMSVPFSLRMAASRLHVDRTDEGRDSVIDLLWETALYVEDGALSMSERELRELQDRLAEAMENGAELEELERMLQELQQAMDEFLDEMMRQAMEQMQNMQPGEQQFQEVPPNAQMVERQDLQDMLDQIRDMLQQGMRDEAMEMMAQLREMLENMQTAMTQQQMQPSPGEQALSDLQKMIQMQQNLLDRTHQMQQGQTMGQQQGQQGQEQQGQQGQQGQMGQGQQGQQGQMGQQGQSPGQMAPGQMAQGLGMEQDALRQALGELMRRLGEAGMEIPRSLGQAELQMRDARDALNQGQPGNATGPESNAIDMMQQGGQAMLEQLREQMAQQQGQGMGRANPSAQRQGRDPLGRARRNDGGAAQFGTELPDENDMGRARSVLEELQRRAGERNRSSRELDYLNRLLDRF